MTGERDQRDVNAKAADGDMTLSELAAEHLTNMTRGSPVVLVGTIVRRALALLHTAILTRYLGAEMFGLFALGLRIRDIGVRIARFGMPRSVLKYVSHYRAMDDDGAVRGTILGASLTAGLVGSALAAVLAGAARWVATQVYHDPGLVVPLQILAVGVAAIPVGMCLLRALQAMLRINEMVLIEEIATPGLLALGYWVMLTVRRSPESAAVPAAAVPIVMSTAAAASVYVLMLRHRSGGKTVIPWSTMVKFAVPVYLTRLTEVVGERTDVVILGVLLNRRELGLYALAAKIAAITSMGLQIVGVTFSPIISSSHTKQRYDALAKTFTLATNLAVLMGMLIFGGLCALRTQALGLFGEEYSAGALPLVVLAAGHLGHVGVGHTANILTLAGNPWLVPIDNVIWGAVKIGGFLLLVRRRGPLAASYVAAFGRVGVNVARLVRVWKIYGITPFDCVTGYLWIGFLLGMATCLLISYNMGGVVGGIVGLIVFTLAMSLPAGALFMRIYSVVRGSDG